MQQGISVPRIFIIFGRGIKPWPQKQSWREYFAEPSKIWHNFLELGKDSFWIEFRGGQFWQGGQLSSSFGTVHCRSWPDLCSKAFRSRWSSRVPHRPIRCVPIQWLQLMVSFFFTKQLQAFNKGSDEINSNAEFRLDRCWILSKWIHWEM